MNMMTNPSAARAPGCTVRTTYLDEHGEEHHAVHHMTQGTAEMQRRGVDVRAAAQCYYHMLGYELLSVQLMMEHATQIEEAVVMLEPKRQARLRLVASGGKRLISDEARHLAESAGIDPDTMFGSTPD